MLTTTTLIVAALVAFAQDGTKVPAQDTPSVIPATPLVAPKVAPKQEELPPPTPLGIGDAAPAFLVDEWVKGESFETLEKGKVHVLEFWATWCGPCIVAIPHVTANQKQYPDVRFVGVAASESGSDETAKLAKVKKFVEDKGDVMGYRVVYAGDRTKMSRPWMLAAGQNGIPCTFIVDQANKVAWIGHPSGMDKPLADIVAGTWDISAAAKMFANEKAVSDIQKGLRLAMREAKTTGDYTIVVASLRKALKITPSDSLKLQLMQVLGGPMKQPAEAWTIALDVMASNKDNASMMNQLAWMIVDDKSFTERNLDIAIQAATYACEATKNKEGAMIDTLAAAVFMKGDVTRAIDLQKQALEVTPDGAMKTEMKATLEKYEAARKTA